MEKARGSPSGSLAAGRKLKGRPATASPHTGPLISGSASGAIAPDSAIPGTPLMAAVSAAALIAGPALPEAASSRLRAARVVEQRANDAAQAMSQRFRAMIHVDCLSPFRFALPCDADILEM
jgi:hypothetical protein